MLSGAWPGGLLSAGSRGADLDALFAPALISPYNSPTHPIIHLYTIIVGTSIAIPR
jgi:hypothetical protein